MDNSLKDKVLQAVDIVDVIGERVALKPQGRELVGLCPFHNDHRPSMSVSPQKQIFKCWSCGAGGDVFRFIELYERVDFREALLTLARRANIDADASPSKRRDRHQRDALLPVIAWARDHFRRNLFNTPAGKSARDYALQRGLSTQTIERYALGLALPTNADILAAAQKTGISLDLLLSAGLVSLNDRQQPYDRFRNRLIFPIADAQGRPIAFGGRTLGNDRAKYLNSPETPLFSKSRVLYGLDLARQAIDQHHAVIVVEGYLDAVLLAQFGFNHVVATLGTALTDSHVRLLRARAETIYLCFDSDDAGVRAADRAVEVALRSRADVRVVCLDSGKDPADCLLTTGTEGFQNALNTARDALEFKWSQILSVFGQGGQAARRAATEEYVRFVAGATQSGSLDPVEHNLLIGRLADLLGIPAEAVFDMLLDARRKPRPAPPEHVPGESADSDYDLSVRGLPAGLVTATETVLGLLLITPACWTAVTDDVAHAVTFSQTWQDLYRVLLEVHQELGEYSIGDVVSRCEQPATCDLVSRARARVEPADNPTQDFTAVRQKLNIELSILRSGDLAENLRRSGGDDELAFRQLHAGARLFHSALPADTQRNSAYLAPPTG